MRSPSSTSSSSARRAAAVCAASLLALQIALCAAGHPSAFFHSPLTARQYERARALARRSGIDVIAMGNSQIHVGFDAALFAELTGREAFNFSLDGADVVAQARFLRDLLVPTFRPSLVVWGISPRDLNASAAFQRHTQHDRILQSPALRTAALPGGWRLVPWVKDWLPFHRRSWEDWCRVAWHQLGRAPETLDARGWRARPGSYEPEPFRQVTSGHYYDATFSPAWHAQVRETFAALRDAGVDLRVVTAPVHPNTVGLFHPDRLDEAFAQLAGMTAAEGVAWSDWFQDPEFAPASLYHDAIHLNVRGAERFTRRLAERLAPEPTPIASAGPAPRAP